MRVAIFGDVGAWTHRLSQAIWELGGDPDAGELPADVQVIQVGDLVHKGPDNKGVLALVDRYLVSGRHQWTQLAGNHEAIYLGGPDYFWRHELEPKSADVIRRWVHNGQAQLAVALESQSLGPTLVTHAGLTYDKWRSLGAPEDPLQTALALNAELADAPERAFASGESFDEHGPSLAGVTWASPSALLASWHERALPFSQVYGHSTPRSWHTGRWIASMDAAITAHLTFDEASRHVTFHGRGDKQLICVDPAYGVRNAPVPLTPLILDGRLR